MRKKERKRDYGLQWNKNTTMLLLTCLVLLLICLTLCGVHLYRLIGTYRNFVDSSITGQTGLDAELVSANLDTDIQVIRSTAEQLQQNENYEMDELQIYKLLLCVRNKSGLPQFSLNNWVSS